MFELANHDQLAVGMEKGNSFCWRREDYQRDFNRQQNKRSLQITAHQTSFFEIITSTTSMPPKQQRTAAANQIEYKTDWATSEAKRQLKKDILDGRIEGWDPKEVYFDTERHERFYKWYRRENFTTNLRTLRESITKGLFQAKRDKIAFDAYMASHPLDPEQVRWHGSAAQKLLRRMIRAELIDNMKPREVRAESPLFSAFTLKKFRDHLDHEKVRHWKKMHDEEYAGRVRFLKSQINVL